MIREQERISLGQIMAAILLLLAGTLLFFYHLGKVGFTRETPARIALYAQQMNAEGQWSAPILRGQARVDVPPLYLWATRLASGFSASVTPFQERLPGALSAMALVLLAAWWLYRHAERYTREDMAAASPEGFALLGGLILASNPVLFSMGRAGVLNTMFVLLYLAAAFCWGESLEARRSFYAGRPWRNWILWGYFLAGVAMLVRGPLVLPLLLVPYWLAARSYHLRRPDWVHGAGLALALAVGATWPVLISIYHPEVAAGLWREWLTLHVGNLDATDTHFYEFLRHVVTSSFPWNLLALGMALRVWWRKDRSPTLVFWTCSLVGNLLVLTFLSNYVGQHRLPVIVFISLLAADALYRWNFENAWALAWRVLLRLLLVGGTVVCMIGSLLLKSDLGLLFSILVPLAWIAWALRSRMAGMQYTPWETALRLSAMLVCVLIVAEAVLLGEYEPKRAYYDNELAYFHRIEDRLDDESRVFLQNDAMGVLYDYLLNMPPVLSQIPAALRPLPEQETYLFADESLKALGRLPNLEVATALWNNDRTSIKEAMLRVVSDTPQTTATATATTATLAGRQPQRLALLGNQGTRTKDQRTVGRQLNKYVSKNPLDDVLLLGNNLFGPSILDHLDFVDAFEVPYKQLLKRGVTFHAALGHEDQSWASIQLEYPAFNMPGRYYAFTAAAGRVEVFVLDGERLFADKKLDERQMAWLEAKLARSSAPWKVVGLNRALASAAKGAEIDEELSQRLLPLFDRHKVNFVAWAGGTWYERLALPDHAPVFINAGWSGKNRKTSFNPDPRLKLGYGERPGFIVLEFFADRAVVNAINDKGKIVDRAEVPALAAPVAPQPPAPVATPIPVRGAAATTTVTTATAPR